MKQHGSSRGFTLIELLVVIVIIAILSVIVLAALNTARAKSRDARRLQDLNEIRKAVELYYAANDVYPTGCEGAVNTWVGHGSNYGDCDTNYIEGIGAYLVKLPIDPSGDNTFGYVYKVSTNRKDYKVMSYNKVETKTVTQGSADARCPLSCSTQAYCKDTDPKAIKSFARYTDSAACW